MSEPTKVLIVDDDADFADYVQTGLDREGCEVFVAADGVSATSGSSLSGAASACVCVVAGGGLAAESSSDGESEEGPFEQLSSRVEASRTSDIRASRPKVRDGAILAMFTDFAVRAYWMGGASIGGV